MNNLLAFTFLCPAWVLPAAAALPDAGGPVKALVEKMPAADMEEGRALTAHLLELGSPAILEVCRMLREPGRGDDRGARFALHGMAFYAARPGGGADRARFETALLEFLRGGAPVGVKAFVMEQLELSGGQASVPVLARSLGNERLCEPAARALVCIGGEEAARSVTAALSAAKGKARVTLLLAAGRLGAASAVEEMLKSAGSADREERRAAWYALALAGDARALSVLEKAAASGDRYDRILAARALRMLSSRTGRKGKVDPEAGFKPLFNGRSLDGWMGDLEGWAVEEGRLVCGKPGMKRPGNLYTKKEFSDFVLRFEFKLTAGANNGIGLRCPFPAHAAYDGMEIQILDDTAEKYARLKPYQYHGSVYGVVPARRGFLRPVGQWNEEEVTARGTRITVRLNGRVIVDADLKKVCKPRTLDGKDHPGLFRESGHVVLLGHGSHVEFRKIRIQEL